jgi:hypothetical protein
MSPAHQKTGHTKSFSAANVDAILCCHATQCIGRLYQQTNLVPTSNQICRSSQDHLDIKDHIAANILVEG